MDATRVFGRRKTFDRLNHQSSKSQGQGVVAPSGIRSGHLDLQRYGNDHGLRFRRETAQPGRENDGENPSLFRYNNDNTSVDKTTRKDTYCLVQRGRESETSGMHRVMKRDEKNSMEGTNPAGS